MNMNIPNIFELLKEIFHTPSYHDNLEAYIAAGNPQSVEDVDRLEREYHQRRQVSLFERYY